MHCGWFGADFRASLPLARGGLCKAHKISFDILLDKYPKFRAEIEKISEERETTSQEHDNDTHG